MKVLLTDQVRQKIGDQYFYARNSYHVDFLKIVGFTPKKIIIVPIDSQIVERTQLGDRMKMKPEVIGAEVQTFLYQSSTHDLQQPRYYIV